MTVNLKVRVSDGGTRLSLKAGRKVSIESESCSVVMMPKGTYEGSYTVVPSLTGYSMKTEGMVMAGDVTVKPIPIAQATNAAGGYTYTIG